MEDIVVGQEVIIINSRSTYYLGSGKVSSVLSSKMYKVKMKLTGEEIFFLSSELGEKVDRSS